MNRKRNLTQALSEEKEKLRGYTLKQKIGYIRDYYWLWILGVLTIVVLSGYIIYRGFFTVKDYWFYGVFTNTFENGGNRSQLWQDFVDYGNFDLKEKNVMMNSASYFDASKPSGTNNSYFQSFVAVSESGDLDIVTAGRDSLVALGQSGRLMDLNNEGFSAIRERYGERFVYCEPYDEAYSTELVPVGIDLSDSLLVTKYHLYEDDCVLGISAYTQRKEAIELFLEFVFS